MTNASIPEGWARCRAEGPPARSERSCSGPPWSSTSIPTFGLHNGGTAQFGVSVVVTEKGARRLGLREMKLVTLGA